MQRHFLALMLLLLPTLAAHAAEPAPLWLAVVADDFAEALAPLVTHRKRDFRVVVVKTSEVLSTRELLAGDASKLRDHVQALCRKHQGTSHVLLVGAVDSIFAGRIVPPCRGTVSRMKNQPTDLPYGCPKGGRVPTVAVGRFPARNVDEVTTMVNKTLALEKASGSPGEWKRRITVLAGIPAYNPIVDRLVEAMAMSRFDRLHPMWTGRAVYTNPNSRFFLPPAQLRTKAIEYLGEGQAFTVYLGHSNAQMLYGGPNVPFLDRGDWGKVKMPNGGVFVTFGCNGCQLEGEDGEGYGLWAMRNPNGPAAVLGSHGICFAAMVNLAADGLFKNAFQSAELPERLAPAWLALQDGVAKGNIDWLSYRALDAVDGDSRIPQATQRQEHGEMFVLLGDPALQLPSVEELRIDAPQSLKPGAKIKVSGQLPKGMLEGRVVVSVERPPATAPLDVLAVPREVGALRDRVVMANHASSNRFAMVTMVVSACEGQFAAELTLPEELPATCVVRVWAATKTREATAAQRVERWKEPSEQ